MQDVKASVQQQFGNVAANYAASVVHSSGEDLSQMLTSLPLVGSERLLDAGCGAGHTGLAFAGLVQQVVAYDLTPTMLLEVQRLASERGIKNLLTHQGDVEQLPFEASAFDVVVSRYSAHHWPHPVTALQEFHRVLITEGYFLLSDIVAPEEPALDTFLQTIELLRDPSHVRDHSISQWLAMLKAAGFEAEVLFTWQLPLDFDAWVKRINTPVPQVEVLKTLFDGAPLEVRTAMDIQPNYQFSIPGALFRAQRI